MKKKSNLSLLYVEDDPFILENAVEFLSDKFLEIYKATDGKEALELYFTNKPDIIITDIQMPNINGLKLCKEIRKVDNKTPIIITTAFAEQEYLLEAVELNLVKYLIKPIQEDSLLEALALCTQKERSIIQLTNFHYFDTFNQSLFYNSDFIKLTSNELKFLTLLVNKKDRVILYKEIENYVYDGEYMSEDALKSLVKNLRKKISKEVIENHSKLGYKLKLYHG